MNNHNAAQDLIDLEARIARAKKQHASRYSINSFYL